MEQIINYIKSELWNYSQPEKIDFYKRSIPTRMEIWGVTAANQNKIIRQLKHKLTTINNSEIIKIAILLCQSNIAECTHLAYELLGSKKQYYEQLSKANLKDLAPNLDNWATVDTFAVKLLGKCWREGVLIDDDIQKLIESESLWIKRLGIVSTIPFNQRSNGGKGNALKTLWVCEKVMDDKRNLIVKAVSWSLRELAKQLPDETTHFINKNKKRLHPLVVREVRTKIKFGKKSL